MIALPVPMEAIEVAIAIILHADPAAQRVLISQRRADHAMGGYWEFAGGKCEVGEAPAACVIREVREELGIEVRVLERLAVIEHEYADQRVRLHPFLCRHAGGAPRAVGCARFEWVGLAELAKYRFPPANDGLIEHLAAGRIGGWSGG